MRTAIRSIGRYVDNCPDCIQAVPCTPLHLARTQPAGGDIQIGARYSCPRCMHTWHTSWQPEPADR